MCDKYTNFWAIWISIQNPYVWHVSFLNHPPKRYQIKTHTQSVIILELQRPLPKSTTSFPSKLGQPHESISDKTNRLSSNVNGDISSSSPPSGDNNNNKDIENNHSRTTPSVPTAQPLLTKGARRLSLLRQRPVQNEKFSDIQLKPVVRKPVEPQIAEQMESLFLKVVLTLYNVPVVRVFNFYFYFFYLFIIAILRLTLKTILIPSSVIYLFFSNFTVLDSWYCSIF